MKIQKINIEDIKPYWRNPRKIEKAVEVVKKSISEYGYNSPILLDKENVIIAGHTRYQALKQLGFENIDCVIAKNLSEDKVKQYRIIDNKTSEFGEWDNETLMYELREIKEIENMSLFFTDKELEKMDISIDDFTDEFKDIESEKEEIQAEKEYLEQEKSNIEEDRQEVKQEKENIENEKKQIEEEKKQIEERKKQIEEQEIENKKINEKIKKIQEEEENKFKDRSNKIQEDYIDIICPICEESYTLSKRELLQSDKIRKNV